MSKKHFEYLSDDNRTLVKSQSVYRDGIYEEGAADFVECIQERLQPSSVQRALSGMQYRERRSSSTNRYFKEKIPKFWNLTILQNSLQVTIRRPLPREKK